MDAASTKLVVPQLLLIGAFARNSGKTTLACGLIRKWKECVPVYAAKIIGIDRENTGCHRGKAGCGLCTGLQGDFEILEEDGTLPMKDTAQMQAAGATRTVLIKSKKTCIQQAFLTFLKRVPKDAALIVESNTLRNVVVPGAFVFASYADPAESMMKESARQVYSFADLLLNPAEEAAYTRITIRKDTDGGIIVQPLNPSTYWE